MEGISDENFEDNPGGYIAVDNGRTRINLSINPLTNSQEGSILIQITAPSLNAWLYPSQTGGDIIVYSIISFDGNHYNEIVDICNNGLFLEAFKPSENLKDIEIKVSYRYPYPTGFKMLHQDTFKFTAFELDKISLSSGNEVLNR
jgi:hypothetical protein